MAVGTPQTHSKVLDAFRHAPQRTALRGISNRVLGGTSGTAAYYSVGMTEGTAACKGVGWTNPVATVIDGVQVDIAADLDLTIPALGTQGSGSYCKYLVYAKSGSSYVAKGNEATAASGAKLPDLPDSFVALGYFQVHSTGGVFTAGVGIDSCGAAVTYADLITMPIDG